ncbi:MAG TPA: type II secretion system protein GspM [Candidatus Limnocylindrales bacterium]|nr:type II secretion system protein GspM [Candidatus Limnocylindrales bacterium]
MNARLHQAQLLVARLSPREQRLVAIFASLVAAVVFWSLIVSPFLGGRDKVHHEIDGLRSELGDLESLARQIRQVQTDAPKGGASAAKPTADFSVLSFVEKAAAASLRPESIASMSPARRALEAGRVESTVELKLSSVTLGEVVALLRAVEDEKSPVYIKQFSVKKRYDDSSRFDVTLVTAATLPA